MICAQEFYKKEFLNIKSSNEDLRNQFLDKITMIFVIYSSQIPQV